MDSMNELMEAIEYASMTYGTGCKSIMFAGARREAQNELDSALDDTRAEMRKSIDEFRKFTFEKKIYWEPLEPGRPKHMARLAVDADPVVANRERTRKLAEGIGAALDAYANAFKSVGDSIISLVDAFKGAGDVTQDDFGLVR